VKFDQPVRAIFNRRRIEQSQRGFTLIELLVVIALIGLVSLLALPTVSNIFQVSLGSATREIASTIKETYNSAMITGKVYRIAYDLKEHQFWAESGPTTTVLQTEQTREKEKRRKRFALLDTKDEPPPSPFQLDKGITRAKKSLPRGVEFADVLTERDKDPLQEGIAYSHIFPSGITERTLIHLKDSQKHELTLAIETIGGKTRMLQGNVTEKEAFGESR